jgi:hypothetical protein
MRGTEMNQMIGGQIAPNLLSMLRLAYALELVALFRRLDVRVRRVDLLGVVLFSRVSPCVRLS